MAKETQYGRDNSQAMDRCSAQLDVLRSHIPGIAPTFGRMLPDETRQFEAINGEFTTLMGEAEAQPNVVLACTNDVRMQLLIRACSGSRALPEGAQ